MKSKLLLLSLTAITIVAIAGEKIAVADPRTLPEYTAAEAKKHIGETARVTDKVGCVAANRGGGYNLGLGECGGQTPFWIVTHGDIKGPKLDVSELKGVVVSVTGKIDNESVWREYSSNPLRK